MADTRTAALLVVPCEFLAQALSLPPGCAIHDARLSFDYVDCAIEFRITHDDLKPVAIGEVMPRVTAQYRDRTALPEEDYVSEFESWVYT